MVIAAGWKVRLIEPDGSLSQITEKRGQADALDL